MTVTVKSARGTLLAGVIGWPVAQSLSPALHRFWLERLGIDGDYVRLPVRSEDLAAALHGLGPLGYCGVNVTVPHKEAVLSHIDHLTDRARRIGAVNILSVHPSGRLHGDNSDAVGFLDHLLASVPDFALEGARASLFGAGGAARAIAVALLDAGVASLHILNRSEERAEALAAVLADRRARSGRLMDSAGLLPRTDLLVNATTLGMVGQPPLACDVALLPDHAVVYDIVYKPLETPLLKAARARGLRTVDGLGMLIHQAVPAFAQFYGAKPPLGSGERAHLLARLGGDPSQ
ncbi:MAG: shikimate dehydrogenase [Rhodothalassiaceae bacterium]